MRTRGFTLIELLIVVGIIAVLALIAVPNFLEAQTRAKVTRARADLRTIASAVESYAVDNNKYPTNVEYQNVLIAPNTLTTPIAYISSIPFDPFRIDRPDDRLRRYEFHNVRERVDANTPNWPANDLRRYGDWRLTSYGPRREYLPYIPYDPTNGTISEGNVLRTQIAPDGRIPFTYWNPSQPQV